MKKKNIVVGIIAASLMFPSYAYAEDGVSDPVTSEPNLPPVEDPRRYPNIDILPPPSEELVSQDPWTNSSLDPEHNNDQIDPTSQDEVETWAVVDENGNTINIISCDVDYCGSGWIPVAYDGFTPTEWARVVLQAARDPQTGNNNGGHWGQYNFPSGVWTQESEGGGTYQIPIEYGQNPICLLNCPEPEEVVDNPEIPSDPEEQSDPEVGAESGENSTDVSARSFSVSPNLTKTNLSFSKKFPLRKNIKSGNVWIIATNDNNKFVWKVKVAKRGKTNITLPTKYIDWNISINYTLVNNKKFSNKILFI